MVLYLQRLVFRYYNINLFNTAFVWEFFMYVRMCLMSPPCDSGVDNIRTDIALTQLGVTLGHIIS